MGWGRIKIDPADSVFSWYIRTRDDWTCTRCGKYHEPPTSALHASHFHSRRHQNTRFDLENCDAHCYGCHRYFEGHPQEFYEWKLKQLGEKRLKALIIRKETYKQKDYKMAYLVWKQAMKDICREKGTREWHI